MSCRRTDEIVAALTGPGAQGIDGEQRRHLDHCARCQAAVRRADALDRELTFELGHLRTDELPRSVLTASRVQPTRSVWRRPLLLMAGTATVAVAAVVAGIALAPSRPVSNLPFGASGADVTISPAISSGPLPSATPDTSPLPSEAPTAAQLQPGAIAAVVDEPLVLRSKPGTGDAASITADRLWKGQRVRLLEGPVEADGYPWWRVRIGEIEGWVATEEKDGSKPWIAPISNGEIVFATTNQELRIIDPAGGEPQPFLSEPLSALRPVVSCGSSVKTTWSADGSFAIIAYAPACDTSIYRVAADGSAPALLSGGADPTITGDGARIAFGQNLYSLGCMPCPAQPAKSWDIEAMPIDGSSPPESITTSAPGFVASHPSWSPDRRSIAFAGMPQGIEAETSGQSIFVTDGTSTRRITDGATPTWSPDGRWIVFERTTSDRSQNQLFRIRPDGSDQQLLGLGYASTVAFSPDGSQLAVVASRDIEHRFLSVGPFGARLADGAVVDDASDPAWSPDGERLAWSLADANAIRLWVGSPDGSNAEPIADGVAPSWRPIIGGRAD